MNKKAYVVPQIEVIELEKDVNTIFESGCNGVIPGAAGFQYDPDWTPCGVEDWGGD